jgi:thiosulfate/3-mercaptopyruvate sulfurtransferase
VTRDTPLRQAAEALARAEARSVLTAAGLEIADLASAVGRDRDQIAPRPTEGPRYTGNSTSQSLTRGTGVESDFINGEVVLTARLAGLAAPVNEAIAERVHQALHDGAPAASLDDDDLLATLPQLADTADKEPTVGNAVLIDAPGLRKLLDAPERPLVLDVRWALGDTRGRDHYREGHIPSAVYADLDTQLAAPPTRLDGRHPLPTVGDLQAAARSWGLRDGQPVVVYDNSGGLAAARAWWLLRWAGVADVRILDGTLGAWREAGLELESGEPAVAPGDVTLSAGHLPVLTADEAAALAADPAAVLLDARAGERYRGETEPVDSRAGHIPGALSAPTGDNLGPDGHFAAADTLRERFAALGATSGATVGVYCGSGVTAAHQVAALAIAGVDAALYPGSWSAWSSDPDRLLATGPSPRGE